MSKVSHGPLVVELCHSTLIVSHETCTYDVYHVTNQQPCCAFENSFQLLQKTYAQTTTI
jgi:hypothetical protein